MQVNIVGLNLGFGLNRFDIFLSDVKTIPLAFLHLLGVHEEDYSTKKDILSELIKIGNL